MSKISLSKIEHRRKTRIKVEFKKQADLIAKIKSISGRRWSATKNCWHLPYATESFEALKIAFGEANLEYPEIDLQIPKKLPIKAVVKKIGNEKLLISFENAGRMKASVPANRKDWIEKIKQIKGRAWNQTAGYWSLPMTKRTVVFLKREFADVIFFDFKIPEKLAEDYEPKNWNQSSKKFQDSSEENFDRQVEKKPQKRQIIIPPEVNFISINSPDGLRKIVVGEKIILDLLKNGKEITAFVPGDKKRWVEKMREIPGRLWESEAKCWILPNVKDTFNRLEGTIGAEYLRFIFEKKDDIPNAINGLKKKKSVRKPMKFKLNDFQKKAVTALEEKLMKEHKSWRTIKTYRGLFIPFLAYFPDTKPSKISKEQIEKYIVYRKQENVSDSQMNQLINTLNCFFIRILNQEKKVVKLKRPKKKKKLPNVFSQEEIEKLLKSVENLKHKCMLILVYSSGLRKSEVLNLRVNDLNFDRKTVLVKNGKGGKDRFTFFADSARKFLENYLKIYQPKYYLFEGQTGGRYSESALQAVYDKARTKAKIGQFVTLHGLRHSFATHLVEKGVPLHVVQNLLGHGSIKTTEIYLHISNKFRAELKSPLDDMEI